MIVISVFYGHNNTKYVVILHTFDHITHKMQQQIFLCCFNLTFSLTSFQSVWRQTDTCQPVCLPTLGINHRPQLGPYPPSHELLSMCLLPQMHR